MKIGIQIALALAMVALSYFIYESIAKPIRFQEEKDRRYALVIQRMKDIRTIELAYKDVYGKFTASFDTLYKFINTDSIRIIKAIGNVPDTLTEEQAVKMKLVIRDTVKVAVKDTLVPKAYALDSLKYVPFTKSVFKMQTGQVETASKVKIQVLEVIDTAPFDPNQVLKMGSLTEANNLAGNWE